jgi:hypothetical protein
MANSNATLNTRGNRDSNTTITPANPSGTKGPGNVAQYGGGGNAAENAQTVTSIVPADSYIQSTTFSAQDGSQALKTVVNVIGTVPPGKAGIPQIRTTMQNPTSLVVSKAAVGVAPNLATTSVNMPDNYLPADFSAAVSTVVGATGAQGPSSPNAAQASSSGKSLSPQHE